MNNKKIYYLLFLLFVLLSSPTFIISQSDDYVDQQDTNLVLVIKSDGNEFVGRILNDNGREILLLTKSIGKIFIFSPSIKIASFFNM